MSDLKPCPFCGGEAAPNTVTYTDQMVRQHGWKQKVFHAVNCIRCGVNNLGLVGHDSPDQAAHQWNRRAK